MAGAQITRNEVVQMIIRVSLVSVATYFSVKWMISQIGKNNPFWYKIHLTIIIPISLDPTSKNKKKAKEKAETLLRR